LTPRATEGSHDRVLGALPLTQVIVDAVNISGQSEPTEPKTS